MSGGSAVPAATNFIEPGLSLMAAGITLGSVLHVGRSPAGML
jgi:hypothetical protein